MAGEEPDYLSEAFFHQYNLITLAGFGALGFLFSGFWFLGAAAEMAYLALVPGDERFQRMIRSEQQALLPAGEPPDPERLVKRLTPRGAKRYRDLQEVVGSMEDYTSDVAAGDLLLVEGSISKLDYLMHGYLKMLFAAESLQAYLREVDRAKIRDDMDRLERQLETETNPRIEKVRKRNLDILKARIRRLDRAIDELEYMNANLSAAEDTVRLIRDRVVSSGTLGGSMDDLDMLVTDLRESEQHLEEMDRILERGGAPFTAELRDADLGLVPSFDERDEEVGERVHG